MTRALVLLLLFTFLNVGPSLAADEQGIPSNFLNEIANDLDDLNQVVIRAGQGNPGDMEGLHRIFGVEITKDRAEIKAGASKDATKVLDVKREFQSH